MQNLIEIQIQEIGRMPHHNHVIHTTDKMYIYTLLKKSKGKKTHMHRGTKMRAKVDFSFYTIQVRRHWSNIFKVLKGIKVNLVFCTPSENSFQKLRSNKDIFRHRKTERITGRYTL